MITYKPGFWGIVFLFTLQGSVLPKALVWALPATIAAGCINTLYRSAQWNGESGDMAQPGLIDNMDGTLALWSSYTTVLGFLIVFRNNQAYGRFWEGADRIHQVRGKWFNAASSLVAFCNCSPEKAHDVSCFQHCAVRLVSMLHCAALQQVAEIGDDRFEILDPDGVDRERLAFLTTQPPNARCEILIQWLQRMVLEASDAGTLKVAPPILSRVYQELANGLVDLHSVAKIKDVPFPFPYAQMLTLMLLVHLMMTTLFCAKEIESVFWACFMTFVITTCFWSLYYIVLEIEQPFGEDPNDLPIKSLQKDMNQSLRMLLTPEVQIPPPFKFSDTKHGRRNRAESDEPKIDEKAWFVDFVDASPALEECKLSSFTDMKGSEQFDDSFRRFGRIAKLAGVMSMRLTSQAVKRPLDLAAASAPAGAAAAAAAPPPSAAAGRAPKVLGTGTAAKELASRELRDKRYNRAASLEEKGASVEGVDASSTDRDVIEGVAAASGHAREGAHDREGLAAAASNHAVAGSRGLAHDREGVAAASGHGVAGSRELAHDREGVAAASGHAAVAGSRKLAHDREGVAAASGHAAFAGMAHDREGEGPSTSCPPPRQEAPPAEGAERKLDGLGVEAWI